MGPARARTRRRQLAAIIAVAATVSPVFNVLTSRATVAEAVQGVMGAIAGVAPGAQATILQSVAMGAMGGAAGGLINGTTSAVLDENTWRGEGNGGLNFLSTVGSSMLTGTVSPLVQQRLAERGVTITEGHDRRVEIIVLTTTRCGPIAVMAGER